MLDTLLKIGEWQSQGRRLKKRNKTENQIFLGLHLANKKTPHQDLNLDLSYLDNRFLYPIELREYYIISVYIN